MKCRTSQLGAISASSKQRPAESQLQATALKMSDILPDDAPAPRLCHLIKWADFDGYGFNLHAERSNPGQFIGKIDDHSPAQMAGLREGDRIVEVNGVNIANENHRQVVERIKANPIEAKLLVVDPEADLWYREQDLVIKSSQLNVIYMKTPVPRPRPQMNGGMNRGGGHERSTSSPEWESWSAGGESASAGGVVEEGPQEPAEGSGARLEQDSLEQRAASEAGAREDAGATCATPAPMSPDSGRGLEDEPPAEEQAAAVAASQPAATTQSTDQGPELTVEAEINRQTVQVSELSKRHKMQLLDEVKQRVARRPEDTQEEQLAAGERAARPEEAPAAANQAYQPDSLASSSSTDEPLEGRRARLEQKVSDRWTRGRPRGPGAHASEGPLCVSEQVFTRLLSMCLGVTVCDLITGTSCTPETVSGGRRRRLSWYSSQLSGRWPECCECECKLNCV